MIKKDDKSRVEYSSFDHTHEEIAKDLGRSRACVSQIEKAALDKLRKRLALDHDVRSLDDLL
jgi:DNA-directed RNA polymerase specialized sigma subunit